MRRLGWILAIIIVLIVAVRFLVLPPVAKAIVNHEIAAQPGMKGSVQSVGFRLLRGEVDLKGLNVKATQGPYQTALQVPEIDARVKWGPLLHREIIADLEVNHPDFAIVALKPAKKETPEQIQKQVSKKLTKQPPFRIDALIVKDGILHYWDSTARPEYELTASQINAEVRNFANSRKLTGTLFSDFNADALFMDTGRIHMTGKLNPVRRPPEFKLNFKMKGLAIQKLNKMLTATQDIQIKHGILDVASEIATKNGRVDGYVKPVIKDLQVSDLSRDIKKGGIGHAAKEQALNLAGQIAQNPSKKQQATRIPIHGKLDNPKAGIGPAIGATLQNMFVHALTPNLEHSISLAKMPGK